VTYPDAIQFLQELQLFGARFGLETIRRLTELAGHPERGLRFIHVAGTNGKGSVCALLESIYRASGLRVGLFTSPHLVSFTERIQIDRRNISEADVARLTEQMRPWLKSSPKGEEPTFFEAVTLMALLHFAGQKVDLVIWETGLGGRLDATNVVNPLASVITTIGRDHEAWLGDTPAKIAAEKAGIIKPGIPVITGVSEEEPLEVIRRIAAERGSELIPVGWPTLPGESGRLDFRSSEFAVRSSPLLGPHQQQNTAVALATVARLQVQLPVSDEALNQGLAGVSWPGRMHLIERGNQTLLLDGAHNPDGIQALSATLARDFAGRRPTVVFGAMSDKDLVGLARLLVPVTASLCVTRFASERAATTDALSTAFRTAGFKGRILEAQSACAALALVGQEPFVVLTGSLYFVGEALEQLGVMTSQGSDEKRLNNWQPIQRTDATDLG
jgi:dihydrofolate synthase / folylpolyglutamate synthase